MFEIEIQKIIKKNKVHDVFGSIPFILLIWFGFIALLGSLTWYFFIDDISFTTNFLDKLLSVPSKAIRNSLSIPEGFFPDH